MPHVLAASRVDREPSSASVSSAEPPEGTSTEQYPLVRRRSAAAVIGATATLGASERHELFCARAHSFSSEPDENEGADAFIMPVRTHVKHQAASPPPLGHREQQRVVLSPSRMSSSGGSCGAGAGQTAPPAVPLPSHRGAPLPRSLPTSTQSPAAANSSAFSHAPLAHVASSSHADARRTGIVDTSRYHYSTRTTPPQLVPPSPPAPSPQPPRRRSPYRSNQSTSTVMEAAPARMTTTLLQPAPLNTVPTPSSTSQQIAPSAVVATPVAASVPTTSHDASTARWQLSSPEEHKHRSDGHATQGGAVFAYASEAVSTLEQQYGDALQRLGTMHRLYDRLDAHNHSLASELKRVRQVSDTLQNGVAFQLYNSVRQMKHEMRLLKQYVELLSSSFSDRLRVLQQVVREELPRLLGRHDPHSSLLPHGAEGQLKPIETRVSVGVLSRGATSVQGVANAPPMLLGGRVSGASGGVAASSRFYSPEYWWNAMSPHPMRPPSAANPPAASAETEAHGYADVVGGGVGSTVEGERVFSPPGQRSLSAEGDRESNALLRTPEEGSVSHRAYREVQTALADAQRRIVELEQASSTQQADYESRIAQLKTAHRAKEATLKEELALLRRQAGGLITPANVHQLTQLPLGRQNEQPTAERRPCASSPASISTSTVQLPWRASHKAVRSPLRGPEYAAETARQEDGQYDNEGNSTTANNLNPGYHGHAALRRASTSASASITDDDHCDAQHSIGRTNRRALRATGSKGRSRHSRGTDEDPYRPGRYSPTALGRRVQRAREMPGNKACDGERRPQGQQAHSSRSNSHHERENGRAEEAADATGTATVRCSLAYDRLMDHSHPASGSLEKYVTRTGSSTARMPSRAISKADNQSVPRRSSSSRWQSTRVPVRGERRNVATDPELLQSLLAQAAAIDVQGGSRYATVAPERVRQTQRRFNASVVRVAQGLWAQELLKERSCL
ncbi:hypothetical protein JIQ42_04510 [Leishmania sp. Namibia]|uniref:hypothetical protein n=1 Tax=Leishmania sp. Namibia TaxID=2802991 RepID=UPI001B764A1D|nr:hypothetical protein JIQ42_04510 [Leishmania sp. Namibia]